MEESELKALISLLDDEDASVLTHVEDRIKSLGEEIIPYLEEEWERNLNPDVQSRIENLIHTLQYNLLTSRLIEWAEGPEQDLLKGAWLVATYQYPDTSYESLKQDLEQLYYEAWLDFKSEGHPFDQIKMLNSVIYGKLKFSANTKNFHSPGNSMINIVLDTRKGNPILLCIIYMLVAQKLKMPVYGVNLPNLFILTYKSEKFKQFYINAFNRGLIFSKEDIDNYVAELRLPFEKSYYEPCTNKEIIQRCLRNLVHSFEKMGEHAKSEEVKALLQAISDGSIE